MNNTTSISLVQKLIADDSRNVLRHIEPESVHLVVTSPPYNINIKYDDHNDDMPLEEYYDLIKEVFTECYKALVDGGRICVNIDSANIKGSYTPLFARYIPILESIGFIPRATVIWKKGTENKQSAWGSWMSPSNPHIVPTSEYILCFHKGSPKLEGNTEPDISREEFIKASNGTWQFPPETKDLNHPVPFPIQLPRRCIRYYTYPGQTVLDPFAGVCTTAIAALQTGRGFVCIDKSRKYIELGKLRIQEAARQDFFDPFDKSDDIEKMRKDRASGQIQNHIDPF